MTLSYPLAMSIESILAQIDAEIMKLTQARSLLAGTGRVSAVLGSARVKGAILAKGRKRVLSPEARKRIAEAQRRRWAAQRAKSKSK